jgi:hypothetical protein
MAAQQDDLVETLKDLSEDAFEQILQSEDLAGPALDNLILRALDPRDPRGQQKLRHARRSNSLFDGEKGSSYVLVGVPLSCLSFGKPSWGELAHALAKSMEYAFVQKGLAVSFQMASHPVAVADLERIGPSQLGILAQSVTTNTLPPAPSPAGAMVWLAVAKCPDSALTEFLGLISQVTPSIREVLGSTFLRYEALLEEQHAKVKLLPLAGFWTCLSAARIGHAFHATRPFRAHATWQVLQQGAFLQLVGEGVVQYSGTFPEETLQELSVIFKYWKTCFISDAAKKNLH